LAYLNINSWGTGGDVREAEKWFYMAAKQGNAEAQFLLGVLALDQQFYWISPNEALMFLKRAERQGLPEARELFNQLCKEYPGCSDQQ
jgi:TPR repeat protein